jgi:16S rRNA (cytidine1402-2'-O)-methyltransferase
VVLFEAPGRLVATVADLMAVCGSERGVVVAREITKLHEEVWRGTLGEALTVFAAREMRGEVVVVLAGDSAPDREPGDSEVTDALRARLEAGDTVRDAAGRVAGELGVARRRAYDLALGLRRNVER